MKIISHYAINARHAGPKAKTDIERIVEKEYKARVCSNISKNENKNPLFFRINKLLFSMKNLNTNELTLIQLPYSYNKKIMDLPKEKIGIIHDINGLRNQDNQLLGKELEIINNFNVVISHNQKMTSFLKNNGVKTKIVNLEIFDYLLDRPLEKQENQSEQLEIAYTGNLLPNKIEFIHQLKNEKMNYKIDLYGNGINSNINDKIIYKDSYEPGDLPNKLNEDLGLVWSGKKDDSDENTLEKNYLKYNNPHKASCYLAANMPIIVWKKSALAEFVIKNDIGYAINTLDEINNIEKKQLKQKKINAEKIGKMIREGHYTKTALDKAIRLEK